MKLHLSIPSTALFTALVFGGSPALAYGDGTPDGSPPAEESVCDDAGLVGAARGLCIAYCEAKDCDVVPNSPSCDRLHENYTKLTGADCFPCDEVAPPDDD
jgi:hypothetical protein